jgi:cellulose synthase/poly-beta-1,6-N-acetylglucosamine synthase-like glycosyltransferase
MCNGEKPVGMESVARRRIQIYILSRDRPNYLREAIHSALVSGEGLADVVVSDNSETDSVQELVRCEFREAAYIRRSPPLSALEHFRVVIEESSAEFVVFFHDDDVMTLQYVTKMVRELDCDPSIAAIACNGLVLHDDKKTKKATMTIGAGSVVIRDARTLLRPYLSFDGGGHPPFSSYMYRREALRGLYLDGMHGGKHSDVSFLTKLLRRGPIRWLGAPLIWYRVHRTNDSQTELVSDRLNWLRYLIKYDGIDRRSPVVRDFKLGYWSRWWFRRPGIAKFRLPRGWRQRVVFSFLVRTAIVIALTRPSVWRKLLRRVFLT